MDIMDFSEIDRAAMAGFNSVNTDSKPPSWVYDEQILIDAWHCGRTQALDKLKK